MSRPIAWFLQLIGNWITWDDRTRPRRGDDPAEAHMKALERQSVFSFLLALALTAVWAMMRFFGHSPSANPIIAAIDGFTQMATSVVGWFALLVWALTGVFVVMAYSYDPTDDYWR